MGHQRRKNPNAQAIPNPSGPIFSTPAYYHGMVYLNGVDDVLRQYKIVDGKVVGPIAVGSTKFGYSGATPSVSADGSRNAIVWTVQNAGTRGTPKPPVLHAYDATNISHELYNSAQAGPRDQAGTYNKFAVPTISNGKVYVATQSTLNVYGLINPGLQV